jgi:signal transduction histidine kinase
MRRRVSESRRRRGGGAEASTVGGSQNRSANGVSGAELGKTVDELWLDTLQRINARIAHELKGALNGVSVNLEVVRSRAEKPDSPASAVSQYAATAATQLGLVIGMTEALLVLSRPAREPVELPALVRRFEAAVAPPAKAEGRSLTIAEPIDVMGSTPAPANAVRLALGAALLRATREANRVICRADVQDGTRLEVEAADGEQLTLDAEAAAAVAAAGIRMQAAQGRITIAFPAAQDERTPGRS